MTATTRRAADKSAWTRPHLLGLEELTADEIVAILDTAEGFAEISTRSIRKVPTLRGRVVVNFFYEPSTRTRLSFSLAAQRLSADVLDFSASSSSTKKGETLIDTAKNIEAMGVDIFVVRHSAPGAAAVLARNLNASVVNAGDGAHEHPTQALLDLYTIRQRLGRIDGLHVAIVGDIGHSRVARSNIWGLVKLGAKVTVVGPPTLVSNKFAELHENVSVCHDLDAVLPEVDVLNMLRIQMERQGTLNFPSLREYSRLFGLTSKRLERAKPEVVVMHPGPINRGVELAPEVADGPNSVILQQVSAGLAVRMAVLFLVSTARQKAEAAAKGGEVMPGQVLIAGGRVVDPARGVDGALDVLIDEGRIVAVAPGLANQGNYERVLDARGRVVVPGLVDMHAHFREPGREADETIASGSAAAVRGGFTSVAVMPNTEPAIDNEASAEFQVLQGKRAGKARIYPIGAITKGRRGDAISEMGGLVRGGAVGFSDDGDAVRSAEVMRCAMLYAKMLDRVVIEHAEDPDLARNGVMHSGLVSLKLGLSGKSAASEEVMVARDITLAGITGARLHIAHVSTAGSVQLVRQAKKRGIRVTCEACPHHFTLTDQAIESFNPVFKVNPPLRGQRDVDALVEGLLDGTIDAIASDHAPHSPEKKDVEFQFAPNGMIGIETMVPVAVTTLIGKYGMPLSRWVEVLSTGPARILGLDAGTLAPGQPGDVTVLDLDTAYTVTNRFRSNSENCPFVGWDVRGRAEFTLVGGQVVYDRAAEEADATPEAVQV